MNKVLIAQWFNTAYQNKPYHEQRVVYNMDVDKHFYMY